MNYDIWEDLYCEDYVETWQDQSDPKNCSRSELPKLPIRTQRKRNLRIRNLTRHLGMIPWFTSGFQ